MSKHQQTSEVYEPRELLVKRNLGILATLHPDGRPQLSPVAYHYEWSTETLWISTREKLVKANNLGRDARAALSVTSDDDRQWATAEGTTTLTGPSDDPHSPEIDALVTYYREAAGEHPDWDDYRAAMVRDRRVLITMQVTNVYGADVSG